MQGICSTSVEIKFLPENATMAQTRSTPCQSVGLNSGWVRTLIPCTIVAQRNSVDAVTACQPIKVIQPILWAWWILPVFEEGVTCDITQELSTWPWCKHCNPIVLSSACGCSSITWAPIYIFQTMEYIHWSHFSYCSKYAKHTSPDQYEGIDSSCGSATGLCLSFSSLWFVTKVSLGIYLTLEEQVLEYCSGVSRIGW